jgi:hypothetical protein
MSARLVRERITFSIGPGIYHSNNQGGLDWEETHPEPVNISVTLEYENGEATTIYYEVAHDDR